MKYEIRICGDSALLVVFNESTPELSNENARWLYGALTESKLAQVAGFTVAMNSVGVVYDPAMCRYGSIQSRLSRILSKADKLKSGEPPVNRNLRMIPVCYSGACAPDIRKAADALSVSVEQLIETHSGAELTVHAYEPGVGVLLTKDLILKEEPGNTVKAQKNSVILGRERTFISPDEREYRGYIIGKAALEDDEGRALQPGDRVRFSPVTENRMKKLDGGHGMRDRHKRQDREKEDKDRI